MTEKHKTVVVNFLVSLDTGLDISCHIANCHNDAKIYKWPKCVVTEILTGIKKLYKNK